MEYIIFALFLILSSPIQSSDNDVINTFKEKIKLEQTNFVTINLHDIQSVKTTLDAMYQFDQEVRKAYIEDRNNSELHNLLAEMDQYHTQTIKTILAIHQWPTISQFGPQADHQAWLLVQHADHNQAFQTQCLYILTDLYQKGETNKKNYAYLYDRVALQSQALGMKQKYGTQYCLSNDGEISLRPHDGTIEEINLRRHEVGLSSIEEYFERIQAMYKNK